MALPPLDFLPASARAAYGFIEELVGLGRSANSIIESLKEQGLGVRRQTALDVIARVKGTDNLNRFLRAFGTRAPIPSDLMDTAATNLNKAFTARFKIKNAPEGMTPAIQIGSNVEQSIDDFMQQAMFAIGSGSSRLGGVPDDFVPELEIDRVQKHPAFEPEGFTPGKGPSGFPPSGEGFGHGVI